MGHAIAALPFVAPDQSTPGQKQWYANEPGAFPASVAAPIQIILKPQSHLINP